MDAAPEGCWGASLGGRGCGMPGGVCPVPRCQHGHGPWAGGVCRSPGTARGGDVRAANAGACLKVTLWVPPTPTPRGAQHSGVRARGDRGSTGCGCAEGPGAGAREQGRGCGTGSHPTVRWNPARCTPGVRPVGAPQSAGQEREKPSSRVTPLAASAVGVGDAAEQTVPGEPPQAYSSSKARNRQQVKRGGRSP